MKTLKILRYKKEKRGCRERTGEERSNAGADDGNKE